VSTELSLNGLVGVMETMLEAAKRFQDFERRYLANEATFEQMQQQFRQMYDNAGQLQSLAEERLASFSNLNMELKARHSQGEQLLTDVKTLLEEARACQSRVEQACGTVEKDNQGTAQLAQTLGVVQTLVDKLQTRQANLEQSLVATETLIRDQAKHQGGDDQVTQRQDQLEKTLTALQATQQAEKGLLSHFEKTVSSLKTRVGDLERRPAPKAGGGNEQPAAAVAELAAKVEELREQTVKAQELSTQALEKASVAASAAPAPAPAEGAVAPEEFRKFLARCEEDHKAALERESKLAAQWRKALEGLPARTDGAIQRFLEQNQPRLEQSFAAWIQQREQRNADVEQRDEGILSKVIEKQHALESELAKLGGGSGSAVAPEWTQAVEAASAAHTNELRFLKTLLWITLAAVGLSYGLVAYAVILRSS
jgi:hypothetical protein